VRGDVVEALVVADQRIAAIKIERIAGPAGAEIDVAVASSTVKFGLTL